MSAQTSHCTTRRQNPGKKTHFAINFTELVVTTETTDPDQPWSIPGHTIIPHTEVNSILITVPVTLKFDNKFVTTYAFLVVAVTSRKTNRKTPEQLLVPFHQKSEKLLIGGFHQSLQVPDEVFSLQNIFECRSSQSQFR